MSKQISLVVIVIIIVLLGIFLIWPKYQALNNTKLRILEKRAELQEIEKYFSAIRETAEKLNNYNKELVKIDDMLPPDPSFLSLPEFLQQASAQNGLILTKVGSFAFPTSDKTSTVKEITHNFEVSGSYQSLKTFLSALANSSRLIEVESLSFSSPKDKKENFNFSFNIKVRYLDLKI